jgi:hypothetical protein
MDCDRGYGISGYPQCSGNGICIHDRCLCHAGWTSLADMALGEGYDCDININVVKYWSLVNAPLSTIAFLITCYLLIGEYRYLKAYKKSLDYKHFSMIFVLLTAISIFMLSISKYNAPVDMNMGSAASPYQSVVGVFAIIFITCSLSSFYLILVKFLQGYLIFVDPKIRDGLLLFINRTHTLAYIYPIVNGLLLAIVVGVASTQPTDHSQYYDIAFVGLITITYLYYASTVLYVFEIFLREISNYLKQRANSTTLIESPSRNRVQRNTVLSAQSLYDRFRKINFLLIQNAVGGAILNIVSLGWSFLRRKVVYMLIFQSSTLVMVGPVIMWYIRSTQSSFMPMETQSQKASQKSFFPAISNKLSAKVAVSPTRQRQVQAITCSSSQPVAQEPV